jgi:hypothetical protein
LWRVSKRSGAPVEAKLLTPLYAFDHAVLPPGTQVLGHVSRVQAVSKWQRARAILGGDFTPLHRAENNNTGILAAGKQKARDAVDAQLDRIRSIPDLVRGPPIVTTPFQVTLNGLSPAGADCGTTTLSWYNPGDISPENSTCAGAFRTRIAGFPGSVPLCVGAPAVTGWLTGLKPLP